MNEKIKVPEGMLVAAHNAPGLEREGNRYYYITCGLKAALHWLSEHPIVPTEAQVMEILQERVASGHITGEEYCAIPPATVRFCIAEWERHMFDAPEPEVPEEIKDMLLDARASDSERCFFKPSVYNERIVEAYHRGQKNPSHLHLAETEIDMAALGYIADINGGMDIKAAIGKTLRRFLDNRKKFGPEQRQDCCEREPEVPDAVKDLIGEQEPPFPPGKYQWLSLETQRERILEAYRRGQKSMETER